MSHPWAQMDSGIQLQSMHVHGLWNIGDVKSSHRLMEQVMNRMILHNYIGVVCMESQGCHIIPWTQCWMGWTVGYSYRVCMDSGKCAWIVESQGCHTVCKQWDYGITGMAHIVP